jgi:exodeoxyribonuclease VII large subunit
VRDARTDLDRTRKRLGQSTERVVFRKRSTIGTAAARLNALSLLATLARGYAVARSTHGDALTSVEHFEPGLDFELLLHDGKVNAKTKSVE